MNRNKKNILKYFTSSLITLVSICCIYTIQAQSCSSIETGINLSAPYCSTEYLSAPNTLVHTAEHAMLSKTVDLLVISVFILFFLFLLIEKKYKNEDRTNFKPGHKTIHVKQGSFCKRILMPYFATHGM